MIDPSQGHADLRALRVVARAAAPGGASRECVQAARHHRALHQDGDPLDRQRPARRRDHLPAPPRHPRVGDPVQGEPPAERVARGGAEKSRLAAILRSSFGGSPSSGSSPRLCGPAGRWRGERVGGARHLRSPVVAGPFLRLLGPCCLFRGESRKGEGGKFAPSSEYYVLYCMSRSRGCRASGRGASCVLDLRLRRAAFTLFVCLLLGPGSSSSAPPAAASCVLAVVAAVGDLASSKASPTTAHGVPACCATIERPRTYKNTLRDWRARLRRFTATRSSS